MQAGIHNLETFLAGVPSLDPETKAIDRAWDMEPPAEEDVAGVDRPEDVEAANMLGVSVAYASPWDVDDHVRLQRETDQTPTEPTAKEYTRTVTDGQCFAEGSCAVMKTVNDMRRSNLAIKVSFTLLKDFRWVELDDGRRAVISRSWTDQVWVGEGGTSAILQSHSLDVWVEQGDATTWRWQNVWSESKAPGDDATVKGTLKWATDNIFEAGDEAIEALYHGE
jgi:hypothetical protein